MDDNNTQKTLILKRFFLGIFCILAACNSGVCQATYFESRLGTSLDDRARNVLLAPSGHLYFCGFSNASPTGTYDITVTKADTLGNLIWTQYYGKNIDEVANEIILCADGSLAIVGEAIGGTAGSDVVFLQIDTAGNVLVNNAFATPANEGGKALRQTADGGFIIVGSRAHPTNANDMLMIKLDAQGNFEWEKIYGGSDNDYAISAVVLADGSFLIHGDTRSYGAGDYDLWLVKTDSFGNVLWDATYGDSLANGCQGLIVTQSGNYLMFGETVPAPGVMFDYNLVLIDTAGNEIWTATPGGPGGDAAFSAVEVPGSGFVFTGYSNSHNPSLPLDMVVFMTDYTGTILWETHYGDTGIDIGYGIISDGHSGFYACGTSYLNDNDYLLLHLNQNGLLSIRTPLAHALCEEAMYPNPANKESVSIKPLGNLSTQIEVIDMNGRNMWTGQNVMDPISVSLPAGVYVIKRESVTQQCTQKLIVR